MKLLMNEASPFSRKVRILAREKGLDKQIDEEVIKVSPVEVNESVRCLNSLVKIPVLLLDDGLALYDSAVIFEYLDDVHQGDRAIPLSGRDRVLALRSQALCDGLLDAAVLCRYEMAVRPTELQWQRWTDGQMHKIHAGLATLEAEVPAWGSQFGLAQICAVCVLGYLDYRFPTLPWRAAHPGLEAWFNRTSLRPSVKDTVPV